jgi:hypothetical protein
LASLVEVMGLNPHASVIVVTRDINFQNNSNVVAFIAFAGPSHLGDGPRMMADQFALQASGKTLVKQDAHGRRAPPSPALTQPRPGPG